MISLRRLVLPSTESNIYIFAQKMQNVPFFSVILKEYLRIEKYILQNTLTKKKIFLLIIRPRNVNIQNSSTRKNEINCVILSQTARLWHNRINSPFLQKYIGKIIMFAVFKEIWHKPK